MSAFEQLPMTQIIVIAIKIATALQKKIKSLYFELSGVCPGGAHRPAR